MTTAVNDYVAHNLIFSAPHGGILFQGVNNTFEYNEVYNVCTYL